MPESMRNRTGSPSCLKRLWILVSWTVSYDSALKNAVILEKVASASHLCSIQCCHSHFLWLTWINRGCQFCWNIKRPDKFLLWSSSWQNTLMVLKWFNFLLIIPRLWQHVTSAINKGDQHKATQEKFVLEEEQRNAARERRESGTEWKPLLFRHDAGTNEWHYKYEEWVRGWGSQHLSLPEFPGMQAGL